ncbi:MAG: hypothetical protein IPK26_18805 [Planctomycetes bacterium]|nr:hypothetical protein [Planctomycetota bacterium]
MNLIARTALLLAVLAVASPAQQEPSAAGGPPPAPQVINPFSPFDRAAYEARCKQLGATDAHLQTFAAQIAELGVSRAAENLMRAMLPAFDAAVKLSEAADPRAALDLAKLLVATEDSAVQGHIRYQMAKVFLDSDDPDRAVEILTEYLTKNLNTTPLDPEAAFFYAQALGEIPRADLAIPRFKAFLQWFPDASERFRATAQQRIAELERQQESRLHVLADGMKKTTRDLRKQKTDKPVQVEQEGYIEELDELIEMYEEREKQGSGPPSGNGPSQSPASQSGLPDGDGSAKQLEKTRTVADRWGPMKDKDREKIESEVQNSLPPEYRKMLEEYYKKLGTGGSNQ